MGMPSFISVLLAGTLSLLVNGLEPVMQKADAGGPAFEAQKARLSAAYSSITGDDLIEVIEPLSSDAFEGRGLGGRGEALTQELVVQAFEEIGLEPGYKRSFLQPVPLVEVTRSEPSMLNVRRADEEVSFVMYDDFVAFATNRTGRGAIDNAPLVFVGHGIVAPEYDWDDYKGLDVEGAIVVIKHGEPVREGESEFFMGRELTDYYHSATKYKEALARGAIGALVIHTEASAGWPWSLMKSGGSGTSQSFLDTPDAGSKMRVSAQVSEPTARRIFSLAGLDFDALMEAASASDGLGQSLGVTADLHYTGKTRRFKSANFIGQIRGREAPDECIVYTAHWDHVGINPDMEGDQIFNGALDNATGIAMLIEIAEAFKTYGSPRRSIVFIATTAEEKGLLGAKFFAEHPTCAPNKIVAALNMDSHFPFGAFSAMTVPGFGYSELNDVFASSAQKFGRVLQPDSAPEVGGWYRNDALPFANVGIPAIYAVGGPKPEELTEDNPMTARFVDYVTTKYHKPGDEFDRETWIMDGIVDDARIYFDAGLTLAESRKFPNWRYDLKYRSLRDEMMARP